MTARDYTFRDRVRAIHQAAHPELWPNLNRPAIDPAAILYHGQCLADQDPNEGEQHPMNSTPNRVKLKVARR